ncbi:hypothetical protein FTW19_12515 [Terriglobus albidus]|uniref:Secretin/TonB short N-terminal domain-containing protein n=1 Tax=Terriglobus albidus TaxID=1592106 RepID=A0A5B9EAE7_9BACT|nr:hypothetical protein [Terriglobus albidus]QEE28749.1 hypothetical protein FTW19_12515 [Terriglobus albidus]
MPRNPTVPGVFLVLLAALALSAQAQQNPPATLPATPPTSLAPAPAPVSQATPVPPAEPPSITADNGTLTVKTQNSSLNQILREISRKTGMSITGGVTEERVFGTYGPAPAGEVLRQLLDGTKSNMLYQEATASAPAHLTLTTRQGTVTPPNVFSAAADRSGNEDEPVIPRSDAVRPGPQPGPSGYGQPPQQPPGQQDGAQQPQQPSDSSTPDSNTQQPQQQQTPNGVKTPEQLLQQLMQMRQQTPK